jgi:hypothetical protein
MDTIDMLMRNRIVVTVADEIRAARIKAGMVYHLSQLTEWPDGRFENDSTPWITVYCGVQYLRRKRSRALHWLLGAESHIEAC